MAGRVVKIGGTVRGEVQELTARFPLYPDRLKESGGLWRRFGPAGNGTDRADS